VDDKMMVIVWTKRKVDVGRSCLGGLVFGADRLNKWENEIETITHRHVYFENSFDER
jgi:hypothetical protein